MMDFHIDQQYPKDFTLAEALSSATAKKLGINNMPTWEHLFNTYFYLKTTLQPLRDLYGKPITINSLYRCPALNTAVNGSKSSAHLLGLAADITAGSDKENEKLIDLILSNISFDQLIIYPTFIHLGIKDNSSKNRNQIIFKNLKS